MRTAPFARRAAVQPRTAPATLQQGGTVVSDDRLRTSERRWRETGAPEDGRVLLVELERSGAPPPRILRTRVAVGDLPADRLELAAFLGDEAAQEAVGRRPPRAYVESVSAWVSELGAWGPEPWPRITLAMVRLLEREFQGEAPPEPWLARAGDAVEALLRDPRSVSLRELLPLFDEIAPELTRSTRRLNVEVVTRDRARSSATYCAQKAAEVALALAGGQPIESTRETTRAATQRAVEALIYAGIAREHEQLAGDLGPAWDEATVAAHARVRAAVRTALLPWALGRTA